MPRPLHLVRLLGIAALPAMLNACGATTPGGNPGSSPAEVSPSSQAGTASQQRPVRVRRNQLSREQIEAAVHTDLYDLIRAARPTWIQQRGQATVREPSTEGVKVYVDGAHAGGIGALRGISTTSVMSVEYQNSADATTRWGRGHPNGAIVVTTMRKI